MHTYRTHRGYFHISPSLLLATRAGSPTSRLFLATNVSVFHLFLQQGCGPAATGATSAFTTSRDEAFSSPHALHSPGESRQVCASSALRAGCKAGSTFANVQVSALFIKARSPLCWGRKRESRGPQDNCWLSHRRTEPRAFVSFYNQMSFRGVFMKIFLSEVSQPMSNFAFPSSIYLRNIYPVPALSQTLRSTGILTLLC